MTIQCLVRHFLRIAGHLEIKISDIVESVRECHYYCNYNNVYIYIYHTTVKASKSTHGDKKPDQPSFLVTHRVTSSMLFTWQ